MADTKEKKMADLTATAAPVESKLADADAATLIAARKAKDAAELAAHVAARRLARAAAPDVAKATGDKATADSEKAVKITAFNTAVDAALGKAALARASFAAVYHDHATGKLVCMSEPPPVGDGVPRINGKVCHERARVALDDKQADDYAAAYGAFIAASYDHAEAARKKAEYKAAHPELFSGGVGEPPPVDPVYEAIKAAEEDAYNRTVGPRNAMGAIQQAALATAGPLPAGLCHIICRTDTGEIVVSSPDEEPAPPVEPPVEPPTGTGDTAAGGKEPK